jgi:hypothetical protein
MYVSSGVLCHYDRRPSRLLALAKLVLLTLAVVFFVSILTGCQSPEAASPASISVSQTPVKPTLPMAVPPVAMRDYTNTISTNRILLIDPSSMPIAAGTATLTIGALQRVNGIYSGNYKVKVFPFFLKNERGRLAIIVSDESLAKINRGEVAAIIGTAITSGDDSIARHIDATATPIDIDHGMLKLWFMAGNRKMTFEPAYHFADKRLVAASAQVPQT